MLNTALARALDPVIFAQDCGLTPDPWQAAFLRDKARRAILNCSRQSGKTTTTSIAALEVSVNEPGSLVLIGAPAQRQSNEMLFKIRQHHAKLDGAPALEGDTITKLTLGGSRIMALPSDPKTIRGLSAPALIIVDEAGFIDPELLTALIPMLATNDGRVALLSTPNGKQGVFYDAWHDTSGEWTRYEVPATACPRISSSFLASELKRLGPTKYSQEYCLAFVDTADSAFSTTIIDGIFTNEVRPLWT